MYLFLGFFTLSSSIGFFLGVSNTPVVGTFITALFGLIGTVIGTQYLFEKDTEIQIKRKSLGISIMILSVGLIMGSLTGEYYRNGWYSKNDKTLPWKELENPTNTREALDWIEVKERMEALGYSQKEVQEIYRIRLLEKKQLEKQVNEEMNNDIPSYEKTKVYDASSPFNAIFSNRDYSKKASRGLASTSKE